MCALAAASHSNSPSPRLVEKAVFGNPIRQALPSIHSFASAPGQGPPSGLYDHPRMEPNPIAQPRMAYSSGGRSYLLFFGAGSEQSRRARAPRG